MIIVTHSDRRKWRRLVEEILIESRKGSKRARAWFGSDTWQTVSKEMFDTETIAEIEKQALATNKDKDRDDDYEDSLTRTPRYSPEELAARQRASKRAYYHRRKNHALRIKQHPHQYR